MKRVIKIQKDYTTSKYILQDQYSGIGIYQEITENGCLVSQSWLISNNEDIELVIDSYNHMCIEEIFDMIDHYHQNKRKFGVKAVKYCNVLHMHDNGELLI